MRRDDLSQYDQKCLEVNCELIQPWSKWVSPLHEEKQWYGHWKHDSGCTYSQYTEIELQQCIDRRKLYGFNVEGESIASMIRRYLGQRFQNFWKQWTMVDHVRSIPKGCFSWSTIVHCFQKFYDVSKTSIEKIEHKTRICQFVNLPVDKLGAPHECEILTSCSRSSYYPIHWHYWNSSSIALLAYGNKFSNWRATAKQENILAFSLF